MSNFRVTAKLAVIVFAAAVAAALSTVPGSAAQTAPAVQNGLPVTPVPQWAAYISSPYGSCTGELVGKSQGDAVVMAVISPLMIRRRAAAAATGDASHVIDTA